MGLTGDGRSRTPTSGLTGEPSLSRTASIERGTSPSPQPPRSLPDTTSKNATPSRFGFFTSAFTSRMTSPTQAPVRFDDDLCELDIEAALSPLPSSLTGDDFSPAAYKNLQVNAAGLLHRLQDAYRQQAAHIREMRAEHEAQREEVEEMQLRTLSFKSQLEKMAATAAQQQEAMEQLMADLQAERHARLDERLGREKMFHAADEGSVVCSEDLGVDELEKRKRWRVSNSTVKSDLSSADTDGDSAESESIFSRSRSPTAMTSATENEIPDLPTALPLRPLSVSKPKPAPQLTAFQRLVKGISASKDETDTAGCRRCRGRDPNAAWDTISLLRDENIALKQRVAELELAVEAALDVVNGFKI